MTNFILKDDKFTLKCTHLVVAPELGKPVWVDDPEDLGVLVLPPDVGLVAAVGQELVHVFPQQPAVWAGGHSWPQSSHCAPARVAQQQDRAFSSDNKREKNPELTHSTFSARSRNNYNFSGGETEVEKRGMKGRETDGQTGQSTVSFPQGTRL